MKNLFFLTMVAFLTFLACRGDEESVQKIDQVINLYIDSLGQDMLNVKLPGSYISSSMNDVYGLTDNAPITVSIKKDADTISYIEYLAGAKRIGIDSSGSSKTYESKIALKLTKKVNDSNRITNDTMTIQYLSTPEIFQVSKIWYNGVLQFTKVEGQPNTVKIVK
ncbi:hypothetical protein Q73A0000_13410 [Kaistella flava (ex Peng et al. 2021)]|uniref:DUF4251 domain-containing protein n=1 Tax=Kaistella flava (ex Peng et al. 2021) TaxID=2038776 RepID=A0A7M2YCC5_9FLAO|nr:hypothetical protein [Kaistella flava (ex Peng et al. 2021)]QOW11284.1 hypothetical protein Q73A0000_13410 [Kaistella flava (ex Peng et al. 2021)]